MYINLAVLSDQKKNKHKTWDSDPAECLELTTEKHSRLQISSGKVRKSVIFIKGSTEERNSSRVRETNGILSLMAEQKEWTCLHSEEI